MDPGLTRSIGARGRPGRRRAAWLALVVAVALAHLAATREIADRMIEFDQAGAMPARIEVAYVRMIEPETPLPVKPIVAPLAPRPRAARAPRRIAAAASAAPVVAETPTARVEAPPPPAEAPARADDTAAQAAAGSASALVAAASAPADIASAPPTTAAVVSAAASAASSFEWPTATRVSYILNGNYRGPVNGNAQVEWIRVGDRYQVNLDLDIGAGLITRRMTSEGRIGPSGLTPARYDELTRIAFSDRHFAVMFEDDAVVLANGERRERLAGVQDTASQFVQLTYLFSTQPELLKVGNSVAFPLALPRAMDAYVYDIAETEQLAAPFGSVTAFHLKPRPRPTRRPNSLVVELWIAPALRYLPVRIRIEQDAATFIDLMIDRKPEIGEAATVTSATPPRKTP
jgi:hypothetical protein